MIVEQTSKINRNPTDLLASKRRASFNSLAAGRVFFWILLALVHATCQSSSAQQSDNSNKLLEKAAVGGKQRPVAVGRFADIRIVESSGVEMAQPESGKDKSQSIWTFNDSGGDSILFRVNFKGYTEATLRLKGARNRDWETMCAYSFQGRRFIAIGDVGDNASKRKSCQIHVVEEPKVKLKNPGKNEKRKIEDLKANVITIDFKYEDRAHNCEAMAYNVQDNTFWLVEKVYVSDKRKTAPGIFALPNPLTAKPKDRKKRKANTAKQIAEFPVRNVTGMAFSPDGKKLVIRSYFGASLLRRPEGKTWLETVNETEPIALSLPLQSQGEAICFSADSESLLITSELKNAIIWQVSLDQKTKQEK